MIYQLQVDASLAGYGWSLSIHGQPIREKAGKWKENEQNYSNNRLESIAMLKGLRECGQLIESLKENIYGWELATNLG